MTLVPLRAADSPVVGTHTGLAHHGEVTIDQIRRPMPAGNTEQLLAVGASVGSDAMLPAGPG